MPPLFRSKKVSANWLCLLVVILFFIFFVLFYHNIWPGLRYPLAGFLIYLWAEVFIFYFRSFRWVDSIYKIVSFPLLAFSVFIPFISAVSSVIMAYIMALLIATGISVWGIQLFFDQFMSENAYLYCILTFTSIISATMGNNLIRFNHYISDRPRSSLSNRISLLLLDQNKMKYLIFLVYFLILLVSNLMGFVGKEIFRDKNTNAALLQSFATYLAFDRLVSNWKLVRREKSNVIN